MMGNRHTTTSDEVIEVIYGSKHLSVKSANNLYAQYYEVVHSVVTSPDVCRSALRLRKIAEVTDCKVIGYYKKEMIVGFLIDHDTIPYVLIERDNSSFHAILSLLQNKFDRETDTPVELKLISLPNTQSFGRFHWIVNATK